MSALKMFQRASNKCIFNTLCHYSNRTMRTLNQRQFHPLSVLNISAPTHSSHTCPNVSFHRRMSSTTQDKDNDVEETGEQVEESETSEEEEEVESDESQEINELQIKVQELEAELNKYKDALARSHAEKINIQNMNKKDMESTKKFATKGFSKDMLAVMDSLEGCIDAINNQLNDYQKDDNIKSVIEGVKITQNNLVGIFSRHGIKKIHSLHEEFDPNFHEALFKMPSSDIAANHVVQVVAEGYTLKDTVLRAAKVGVSTEPPQPEPVAEETIEEAQETKQEEEDTDKKE